MFTVFDLSIEVSIYWQIRKVNNYLYLTNIIINPVYYYDTGKLSLDFQVNVIAIIFSIIIGFFIFLAYLLKDRDFDLSKNKKIIN